ncbi:MAG: hypothetical protein FWG94_05415 [Oscillospiraceae bacterium]|nr:hypothetical protein [Oscillospiraceae bacterium]
MKSHVAKILKAPVKVRRMMSVSLDGEQMELVEKLSLFFSRETSRAFSKNQVIEEAVRAFTDESATYISEQYDMDIRSVTLTEMREYKRVTNVGIAAFDTVLLSAKDNAGAKTRLFSERAWYPVHLDREKLEKIRYVAFYTGAPTSAVTHYAPITMYEPVTGQKNRFKLCFEELEELPHPIELGNYSAAGLRRPRYTTLSLLLEAKTIEDLFG